MHIYFLHQAHLIIAGLLHRWQRGKVYASRKLKEKSTGFSNRDGLCSRYPVLYQAYLNNSWNLGEDNWICVSDCNLMILCRKCKFTSRLYSKTRSEKVLTKFFHIRNPKTSSGCIGPVVPFGMVNAITCLLPEYFVQKWKDSGRSMHQATGHFEIQSSVKRFLLTKY